LANTLTLNILIGILFAVLALAFLDPVLVFFGASPATLPYARDYMRIILVGNAFTHLYHGFNGIIRASGHPKTAMYLTLFTVLFNAILDPVLIYGLGMGIRGAAIATVCCQALALVYTLHFLSDSRRCLHFPKPLLQLDVRIAGKSLAIGIAPFLMNCAASLVALFINQQLRRHGGDLAIGAYGILNRFTLLFVMICMGFNQGLQPIAGYNYGARQYRRVKEVFILTAKWEVLVTTCCFLISELVPEYAARLFTSDTAMIRLAAEGLRMGNAGFALVGFGIVSANFFQCLGMVGRSIFLSLSRQLLFLLPLLYGLPLVFRERGVWFSLTVSDLLSIVTSAIFIIAIFRKLDQLQDGEDATLLGGASSTHFHSQE
ncbi:MAG: MATE family efflux transporter, partial [Bacteroidales bacterium]|nr:MATE family efflux transporter [Bacteroidales bacterium]